MSADLIDLASKNRQVARELAAGERERLAASQRTADADAATERRIREREAKLRLARERDEADAARAQRRRDERAAAAAARRARRAARRERAAAWREAKVGYVRANAAATFSGMVYGLAVSGAVFGQVSAAVGHGMPAVVGACAAVAIEGFGLSMALTGNEMRLARERALAPRALVWVATALAATINYVGHEGYVGQLLAALSVIGIVVWEIRSAARHRKALRELGLLPDPPERFGCRRWLLHFTSTWAAWRIDVRDRVSPQAAALIARAEQERAARNERAAAERAAHDELVVAQRAERQRTQQAEKVQALARRAARRAARRGDAGAALAALMHLAHTGQPPVQQELPAAPAPLDADVRQLCDLVASQARGARMRLVGSAPAVAPARFVPTLAAAGESTHGAAGEPPQSRGGESTQRGAGEPTHGAAGEPAQGRGESTQGGAGKPARGTGEPTQRRTQAGAPARKRATAADASAGRRLTVSVRGDADSEAALAKAYSALCRELEREPSGAELAEKTGVSKATANRWKQNRESRGTE